MWPFGKSVCGYVCRRVESEWKMYGDGEVKFRKGRKEVDCAIEGRNTSKTVRGGIENILVGSRG